jgi:hypothetical protein
MIKRARDAKCRSYDASRREHRPSALVWSVASLGRLRKISGTWYTFPAL